jgi:MarR family transcriptional regulator, lower aerobic nicotinate degradation pathway regulator
MQSGNPPNPAAPQPAPVRHGYLLDEQVGFLMRIVTQRHTAIFMERMIEGLTPTQFAALAKLREAGPCSQNHLGRLIYLDAATIKGVVDRLRARGFVTTCNDPNDRRRRAVVLSEEGARVAAAAELVAAQITAATLEPLSSDEQHELLRLLKKMG